MKASTIKLFTLFLSAIMLFGCSSSNRTPMPTNENSQKSLRANFSSDKKTIYQEQQITFTDKSDGTPTALEWNFQGGTPSASTKKNPKVTYNQPGKFKVELNIKNSEEQDNEIKYEYIHVKERSNSDFGDDNDGWTIVGDGKGGSNIEAGYSPFKGIGDSGHIFAKDDVTGGVWYFSAPAQYLGDKSHLYNGNLHYWAIQKSKLSRQFDSKDVILKTDDRSIYYKYSDYPSDTWTEYKIPLRATNNWYNGKSDEPVTEQEFKHVLNNLTALHIRGEFETGADTGGLDEFEMVEQ